MMLSRSIETIFSRRGGRINHGEGNNREDIL